MMDSSIFVENSRKINFKTRIDSLHTVCYYSKGSLIAIGMNRENVFDFTNNNIRKSESKSYLDYISTNYQMTRKTIELGFDDISDVIIQEKNETNILDVLEKMSTNKHFKVINRLGSGAFGQVFKVKHHLDDKSYAVKIISVTGIFI